MWTCPKCGREFRRQNQSHYCGSAPADVEEYIAAQAASAQPRLRELAALLRAAPPGARERIRWSMPYFCSDRGSASFAACKQWISLYVGEETLASFQDSLGDLAHKKDALYLPYDRPLPAALLAQLVRAVL